MPIVLTSWKMSDAKRLHTTLFLPTSSTSCGQSFWALLLSFILVRLPCAMQVSSSDHLCFRPQSSILLYSTSPIRSIHELQYLYEHVAISTTHDTFHRRHYVHRTSRLLCGLHQHPWSYPQSLDIMGRDPFQLGKGPTNSCFNLEEQ